MLNFLDRHRHLALALTCLLIFLALLTSILVIASEYGDWGAEYFGAGRRYARIAVSSAEGHGFSFSEINQFRFALDDVCERESLSGGGRVWVDAYSYEGSASASRLDSSRYVMTTVTAVGGDYFMMHDYDFINGCALDLTVDDSVVIDRRLAWELFGSDNVVGMSFFLSGQLCTVSGIVEMPSGYYSDFTDETPRIWIGEDLTRRVFGNVEYQSYEVYFPDPVDGFALRCMGDVISESTVREIDQISGRFDLIYLVKNIPNLAKSAAKTNAISYPFWDNASRSASQLCTLLALLALIALVLPISYVMRLIYYAYKYRSVPFEAAKNAYKKFIYRRKK